MITYVKKLANVVVKLKLKNMYIFSIDKFMAVIGSPKIAHSSTGYRYHYLVFRMKVLGLLLSGSRLVGSNLTISDLVGFLVLSFHISLVV